ncbi:MAG: heme-copper oxidase subunit III [Chloroflexi bacterium]|nr:heme-copper oxidase subunit III [Chloroflexota bacterium]
MATVARTPVQAPGPPPERVHPHRHRLGINRLGLWLFIVSDAVFFGALLSTRYYLQGVYIPEDLSQPLGIAITSVLLLSSFTAYRAEAHAFHNDLVGYRRNIRYTLGLGALFLVGVGVEWALGFQHFPPDTGFGTIFFTTTGIHAFHVVTGLIALLVVYGLSRDGRYTAGNTWAIEGSVKYWHFVDVAWVFIFPTLYLVG